MSLKDKVPRALFTIAIFEDGDQTAVGIEQIVPKELPAVSFKDIAMITPWLMSLLATQSELGYEKTLEVLTKDAMYWRIHCEKNVNPRHD